MDAQTLLKELELQRELTRRKARESLIQFALYVDPSYEVNFHHRIIADEIQDFYESADQKKLMIFVPPQHGKSQLASRLFPAWALGKNPNLKIASISYAIDLPKGFNRDVQRFILSEEYKSIFPDTTLNAKNVANDSGQSWLKNTKEFDVVGHQGGFKGVGVGGGLSGFKVDIGLIDDPFKGLLEAMSPTIREQVWLWYTGVYIKRLHNRSKTILIMTRWHEDDLAGRLLEKEPNEWRVIKLQALKTKKVNHPQDHRQPGEALWESRHSRKKLEGERALDPSGFEAVNQQEPTAEGGNKVKEEWFQYRKEAEVPPYVNFDLWIDGAYTENTKNDPSGFVVAGFDKPNDTLYIKHAEEGYLELPEAIDKAEELARRFLGSTSRTYIEPKASGHSLQQMLRKKSGLYPYLIQGKIVSAGKEARIQEAAVKISAKKVVLLEGRWNDGLVSQLTKYPKASHDEYVDCVGYACNHYFDKRSRPSYTN